MKYFGINTVFLLSNCLKEFDKQSTGIKCKQFLNLEKGDKVVPFSITFKKFFS